MDSFLLLLEDIFILNGIAWKICVNPYSKHEYPTVTYSIVNYQLPHPFYKLWKFYFQKIAVFNNNSSNLTSQIRGCPPKLLSSIFIVWLILFSDVPKKKSMSHPNFTYLKWHREWTKTSSMTIVFGQRVKDF